MVPFDLKVLAKFALCSNCSQNTQLLACSCSQSFCNCSHACILVKVEWTNGTLKYGVHEKLNFLKIQDLPQLNTHETSPRMPRHIRELFVCAGAKIQNRLEKNANFPVDECEI